MIDDLSDIASFYDANPDQERARLDQHQLEYDLTWRYLDHYLPERGSILELGAATGRYTVELLKRRYALTAVDLSPALIELCRQNIVAAGLEGQVALAVADARDLSAVPGGDFDAVLMLGPLYHLVHETDRLLALQQAFDRLRPGGLIYSAFISRFGVLADQLQSQPGWIEDRPTVTWLLEHGRRPDSYPRGGFHGYMAAPGEIVPLHESLGFETLVLAALEPVISSEDELYNRLEGKQRQLWLDLLYRISTEPSILGASRHILYIGQKK